MTDKQLFENRDKLLQLFYSKTHNLCLNYKHVNIHDLSVCFVAPGTHGYTRRWGPFPYPQALYMISKGVDFDLRDLTDEYSLRSATGIEMTKRKIKR